MKKNKMMRLASALLVAVLLSTSVISGTYAKYVSEGTSQDTARVAKWGVTVTGKADMFEEDYEADDTTFNLSTYSVENSVAGEKLVAPGTTDTLTEFVLAGTPEVATRVTYTVEEFDIKNWVADGGDYIPLKITVTDGVKTVGVDGLYSSTNTEATFEAAVVAAIENSVFKKDYEANTDLSTKNGGGLTVTWEWPFSTGDANDLLDSDLGDLSADTDPNNNPTITLKVTAHVTQID